MQNVKKAYDSSCILHLPLARVSEIDVLPPAWCGGFVFFFPAECSRALARVQHLHTTSFLFYSYSMELLLLNYLTLFYVLVVYSAWKRWYYSLRAAGGHRSMKRLERCAPQVLVRAFQKQRYCQHILQECGGVYFVFNFVNIIIQTIWKRRCPKRKNNLKLYFLFIKNCITVITQTVPCPMIFCFSF